MLPASLNLYLRRISIFPVESHMATIQQFKFVAARLARTTTSLAGVKLLSHRWWSPILRSLKWAYSAIGVFTIGPLGPTPPPLNCEKSRIWPKCILREIAKLPQWKITKIVATRCQILRLKCTKFDFSLRSRPRWGSSPDLLAGFSGSYLSSNGKEGKNRDGRIYLCCCLICESILLSTNQLYKKNIVFGIIGVLPFGRPRPLWTAKKSRVWLKHTTLVVVAPMENH